MLANIFAILFVWTLVAGFAISRYVGVEMSAIITVATILSEFAIFDMLEKRAAGPKSHWDEQ
jgi:hypothetical protein